MYLIKKIYNKLFFLLTFGLILGMGIYSYVKLTGLKIDNAEQLRTLGESLLFIAIVFAIFLITIFYQLIRKNQHDVFDVLEKAKEHANQGNIDINSVRSLGKLGEKIFQINQELSELNDRRVERITTLSKENSFLYNILEVPALRVNLAGTVEKVSKGLTKKLQIEKEEIADKSLKDILEDFSFPPISRELESSKLVPIKSKLDPEFKDVSDSYYLVFYPIFNIKEQLSSSVAIMVTEEEYENLSKHSDLKNIPESEIISPIIQNLIDTRMHTEK